MNSLAEWSEFAIAYGLFLLSHIVPAKPDRREKLITWLGAPTYLVLHSLVSILILAWLILAAGRAPYVALWDFAVWQLWVPVAVMLPVCLLISFTIGRPNPFSFGGYDNEAFDPDQPGIVAITRHPILVALLLWSVSHMIPNGDLAHIMLFGGFAFFSFVGMHFLDRRKQVQFGREKWDRLTGEVAGHRLIAGLCQTPAQSLLRLTIGLLAYMLLIVLHPILFGVSPTPTL